MARGIEGREIFKDDEDRVHKDGYKIIIYTYTMPRIPGISLPGCTHHVMARCLNGIKIFGND